jgi:hypothetical protein
MPTPTGWYCLLIYLDKTINTPVIRPCLPGGEAGVIVGTVALKDIGYRRAALRKMFVAKTYRSQAGLAQLLLERLMAVDTKFYRYTC